MAHILIVDDDPDVRRILTATLERKGHTTETGEDGVVGDALLAERRPDVLITDLAMPRCSGVELIRLARRRWPGLPVLAVTGEGRPVTVGLELARLNGADAVVGKPLNRAEVVEAVQRLLAGERPVEDRPDDFHDAGDGEYSFMPPNLLKAKVIRTD